MEADEVENLFDSGEDLEVPSAPTVDAESAPPLPTLFMDEDNQLQANAAKRIKLEPEHVLEK